MAKSNLHAGQINLKGKKFKWLKCQCCAVFDMRDELEKKRHLKEIKEEMSYGLGEDRQCI